jgi:hypothetical protein
MYILKWMCGPALTQGGLFRGSQAALLEGINRIQEIQVPTAGRVGGAIAKVRNIAISKWRTSTCVGRNPTAQTKQNHAARDDPNC